MTAPTTTPSRRAAPRNRRARLPRGAAAPSGRPVGSGPDPAACLRAPGPTAAVDGSTGAGGRSGQDGPAVRTSAGESISRRVGVGLPADSNQAQTTLRPSFSAVQPWAAESCATRYSPSPPRAASRSTAGSGGESPAASLTSISQPEPVVVTATRTGPRPCRSPLLTSSSNASSRRSTSSSVAPDGRLPLLSVARSCSRSARSSASVVGAPRQTACTGRSGCGRGRFTHSPSLMSLIPATVQPAAPGHRGGPWSWIGTVPRVRAGRRRICYGSVRNGQVTQCSQSAAHHHASAGVITRWLGLGTGPPWIRRPDPGIRGAPSTSDSSAGGWTPGLPASCRPPAVATGRDDGGEDRDVGPHPRVVGGDLRPEPQ